MLRLLSRSYTLSTIVINKNIVHRDLKPENILFESTDDDSIIKLVDFGFAEVFNPKKGLKDVLGTPLFIAPEIIAEK